MGFGEKIMLPSVLQADEKYQLNKSNSAFGIHNVLRDPQMLLNVLRTCYVTSSFIMSLQITEVLRNC